jgi:N-acetylglucosamine-6-phosphate deacetylase
MHTAFVNGRLQCADGATFVRTVLVHDATIEEVLCPTAPVPAGTRVIDLDGRLLLPGYIDVQVNGGGGVLFNDATSVEGIAAIGAAHRRFGTTGFLPTLISDDIEVIRRAMTAVDAAIEAGVPGVLGIHIEGPFLNAARKGVHDSARIRHLDTALLPILMSLKRGRTLVTLAPECTTGDAIQALSEAGVIVCAGHTDATGTEIESALRRGLRGFTHLFNAMSPLTSREPGVVGAALLDPYSWCGVIVDGKHVDPRVLRVALAAKTHDRFMLVTDAMPCVGTDATTFMLQGKRIHVHDGYCVDDAGTLAGTALDMGRAVRNAMTMLGLPREEAVRIASETPADFLGLAATHGRIAAGCRADFVVADDGLEVLEVWQGGQRA